MGNKMGGGQYNKTVKKNQWDAYLYQIWHSSLKNVLANKSLYITTVFFTIYSVPPSSTKEDNCRIF